MFTFYSPKLVFGRDTFKEVPAEINAFGNSVLVVTGKTAMRKAGVTSRLETLLTQKDITYYLFERVDPEPDIEIIQEGLDFLQDHKVMSVLAIGGGSVIDVAKVIAGVYGHVSRDKSTLREFLGHDIIIPGLPCIAIPTTAGTGSEVTKNAVILDSRTQTKSSIVRSPLITPKVAIIDPVLMLSMPPKITAASGMDALTQAIEAYVTKKANPFCEMLAIQAIEIIGRNLQQAVADGSNLEVREKMAYGSLLSALAFAISSLGAVHGLAHPIGALFHATHGIVCALLLPHIMEFNKITAPTKFAKIGAVLHSAVDISQKSSTELIERGIEFIKDLLEQIQLPTTLRELGVHETDIPRIVSDTKGSSLDNNPRQASPEDLTQILRKAL
jgi:alcohol dehydrogenase class IV